MKPNEYSRKFEEVYNIIVTKSSNETELNDNLKLLYDLIINFKQDCITFKSEEEFNNLEENFKHQVHDLQVKLNNKENDLKNSYASINNLEKNINSLNQEHKEEIESLNNQIKKNLDMLDKLEHELEEYKSFDDSEDSEQLLNDMEKGLSTDVLDELRMLTTSVNEVVSGIKILTANNQDIYLSVRASKTLTERLISVVNKALIVIEGYRRDTKKHTEYVDECVAEFTKVKTSADLATTALQEVTAEYVETQEVVNTNTAEVEQYREEVGRMRNDLKPMAAIYQKIQGLFK